jgi:DNA-binding transcriptional regulator YdaS (Cro superfamily)
MIEAATQGLITRQQLRPDDWKVIWPELKAA